MMFKMQVMLLVVLCSIAAAEGANVGETRDVLEHLRTLLKKINNEKSDKTVESAKRSTASDAVDHYLQSEESDVLHLPLSSVEFDHFRSIIARITRIHIEHYNENDVNTAAIHITASIVLHSWKKLYRTIKSLFDVLQGEARLSAKLAEITGIGFDDFAIQQKGNSISDAERSFNENILDPIQSVIVSGDFADLAEFIPDIFGIVEEKSFAMINTLPLASIVASLSETIEDYISYTTLHPINDNDFNTAKDDASNFVQALIIITENGAPMADELTDYERELVEAVYAVSAGLIYNIKEDSENMLTALKSNERLKIVDIFAAYIAQIYIVNIAKAGYGHRDEYEESEIYFRNKPTGDLA